MKSVKFRNLLTQKVRVIIWKFSKLTNRIDCKSVLMMHIVVMAMLKKKITNIIVGYFNMNNLCRNNICIQHLND